MAFRNAARVEETSTTTGTGAYSLAGATTAMRTFVDGVGNGNYCSYVAVMGSDWEEGIGLVTDASPDTLARTVVIRSTNADAAVSWGAGTKTITCAPIGEGNDTTSHRFIPITRALSSDHSKTGTTGEEVTGLSVTALQPGVYAVTYHLIVQTSVAATGIGVGINFSGTLGRIVALQYYADAGGSAATNGTIDDVVTGFGAETIIGGGAARTASTTAPNLNVIAAFATADVDHYLRLEALIEVTAAGDLELWLASESGTNAVRIEAGSSVVVQQTN